MTVPEPIKDELFAESDEQLAQYFDVEYDELVASAMRAYGITKPKAKQRIESNETKVRADCYRFDS